MGDGTFYPVPYADVTVGESVMSAGERMHAFGVMRAGGGEGEGRRGRLDTLDSVMEESTLAGVTANGTTFGDDTTLEAAYRTDLGVVGVGGGGIGDPPFVDDDALRRFVVIAPAGKVGMVLDNVTGELPYVHSIKDESPLRRKVDVGDFLLSVDEVDCHGMSAVEASQEITSRSHRSERRLVFLRRSSGDVERGFEPDRRYASF
ncbi:hypothetical protein ACHAXA_007884 [Cyclostephanos tholiformis]|uniref:PDZ domain-containing protein n=1 Tax=Cyclostephanos tholiformis TaxID=382380 RepID=A0ABD3SHE8_9STRA